jgi:hypothetical protein
MLEVVENKSDKVKGTEKARMKGGFEASQSRIACYLPYVI